MFVAIDVVIVPVPVIVPPDIRPAVAIDVTVPDHVPKEVQEPALFLNSIVPALSRKPYPDDQDSVLKFIYLLVQ